MRIGPGERAQRDPVVARLAPGRAGAHRRRAGPRRHGHARAAGDWGATTYLARIDGLVYGDDPRQGFFRDGVFLHPELRFRIDFPQGWRTQNLPQAVNALAPQQDAVLQLTPGAGRRRGRRRAPLPVAAGASAPGRAGGRT